MARCYMKVWMSALLDRFLGNFKLTIMASNNPLDTRGLNAQWGNGTNHNRNGDQGILHHRLASTVMLIHSNTE